MHDARDIFMADSRNSDGRGSGGGKPSTDFEIARRVGGGKTADLHGEPKTETDRALSESRALLERLRSMFSSR